MPGLDVTDVLADPDVAGESFTVIRRQQSIGANGREVLTATSLPNITGSIVPTPLNSLAREEAYQSQQKSIRVVTTFRLRGASKDAGVTYQPDQVVWKGDTFVVKSLDDYSQYGAGFIVADCTSIDLVDQAPI